MSDTARQAVKEAAARQGKSLSSLSLALPRNHAYLQQFIERGVPKRLPEDVRGFLSAELGIPESILAGKLATGDRSRAASPRERHADPVIDEIAAVVENLDPADQQAVLHLVRSMRPGVGGRG